VIVKWAERRPASGGDHVPTDRRACPDGPQGEDRRNL